MLEIKLTAEQQRLLDAGMDLTLEVQGIEVRIYRWRGPEELEASS